MSVDVSNRGPDFFILGAMKSGTTSLFRYLIQHPLIAPPAHKELHYYDHKCYDEWSLDDYLSQFPKKREGTMSGEATAYYLRHPHTSQWIARDFPDARLIVLLRNPVDRAYSHFQQRLKKNKADRPFLDAIKAEDALVADEWKRACDDETYQCRFAQANSYLSRGRYAEQLETWFARFPRERVHVLFTDDLKANPQQEVRNLIDFLDLPPCGTIDTGFREKTRKYAPMPTEARVWAEEYFSEHNRRLEEILQRQIPWLEQNKSYASVDSHQEPGPVQGMMDAARRFIRIRRNDAA